MKKVLFAVALVMGLGTSVALADNMKENVAVAVTANDFTPIDVKDLPQAVQDAIKQNYPESAIKAASVEAKEDGSKTYKVVVTDAAGTESEVVLNENGEVQK